MTNDKLPEDVYKKVLKDATEYATQRELQIGYYDGATAWAQWKVKHDELQAQAQRMADALENIKKWCEESGLKNVALDDRKGMAIYHSLHLAKNALQQFKDGKTVTDPCPHCGKELSRDRNLCCRACGKEVVITTEQAHGLLNPIDDNSPNGMPLPPEDPFK